MNGKDKIINNETFFTTEFIPTMIYHREGQIKELKRCLKPVLVNQIPENVFIIGPTGTGKTVVAKWVLKNYFENRSVYINCWKYGSTHDVLKEILLGSGMMVHGREKTSDLIKKLEKLIMKKRIIVCLDEVDKLKETNILYILARNSCGLVLISNQIHSLMELNSRIRSSLALTEVRFPNYKSEEIFNILNDRAQHAYKNGTFEEELLRVAAFMSNGDARVALETLRRAGRKAEDKQLKSVTKKEIKEALSEAKKLNKSYILSKLNEHQLVIYEILEKKMKIESGNLYKEYCKYVSKPVVSRAYRNYMKKMIDLGLIKSTGKGRWKIYEIIF